MGGAVSYLTNLLWNLPPRQSEYQFFVYLPGETARRLTGFPANARPEDENRVQVAALDDLAEREKRRLGHDPHSIHAGRIASVCRVPPAQGCGELLRSCRA